MWSKSQKHAEVVLKLGKEVQKVQQSAENFCFAASTATGAWDN